MNAQQTPGDTTLQYAYLDIYEEYVENAAFLWLLRSNAVKDPCYKPEDLKELENRIEAQLDALMSSIEISWPLCVTALEFEQGGETFTAAILAFRSGIINYIELIVTSGMANAETVKGLVSAMGWLPEHIITPWIEKFLRSKELDHKYIAISTCSVRRIDPGSLLNNILDREDCWQHEQLLARTIRLAGELRRFDCVPYLNKAKASQDKNVVFWANWSAVMLGEIKALAKLKLYCFTKNTNQDNAIQLVFRVLPIEEARKWISEIAKDEKQIRVVIKSVGILGDSQAVNWLISLMDEVELSRLAAESFTNITGFELEKLNLNIEDFDYATLNPNDNPDDDDITMDEDEELPWPDAKKIKKRWKQNYSNFTAGQRYFMGDKITEEKLHKIIETGNQRQRRAAIIELALLNTKDVLQNVYQRVSNTSIFKKHPI